MKTTSKNALWGTLGGLVLLGLTACGSMQMPNVGQNLWGTSESTSSASQGVDVPGPNAQPMSGSAFATLKADVTAETMGQKKIDLVVEAGKANYFSAAQIGELAATINMKGDRVKLVKATAERILDLDNPGAITSKLTFADERSDVESIMSTALAARQKEEARLEEEARVAEAKRLEEEKQRAEEARLAEEQRAQEAAQAEQESAQNQPTSNTSSNSSSSSSSAYCCLGEKYNTCDSAAAAGACVGFGKCIFDCMIAGGSGCESKCADEHPLVQQCRAEPSKDHLCRK